MNTNTVLDELSKEYLDGTIEGNSKFVLEIYKNHHNLILKENGMFNIAKKYKISSTQINLLYSSNNTNILDYAIKKMDVVFLNVFLAKKKNVNLFIENLKKPFLLYSLLHKINMNLNSQNIIKKNAIFNNIIEIESSLLKNKKHNKTSISDFLSILFLEKSTNILQPSLSDKKLFNLKFILDSIPNKNFNETTIIKGKSISNDLLLITSLVMTGLLMPTNKMNDEDLSIVKKFNNTLSIDLIGKILSLNTVGLESIFDKTIPIKAEKLKNLANSSLCLIELNKENKEFMKSKEVDKCLTLLGNKKIFSYYLDSEEQKEALDFDKARRDLLKDRMNVLLDFTNVNTEEIKQKKKI